jgi:hypothetical protein
LQRQRGWLCLQAFADGCNFIFLEDACLNLGLSEGTRFLSRLGTKRGKLLTG